MELCREYIRLHYGDGALEHIVIYEDEGFSGGDLNRPDFQKMMDTARKQGFKAIVVYRLDRISRNISDFAGLIQELARLDTDFVSVKEQFDTATPMGRAMMYIASVFSQLERETIAERIRDNMRELAKTGRWLGGTTPTGFSSEAVKSVSIDGKTKKVCRLRLIPEEAAVVRLIYELYQEYDSLANTEAELIKRGIRTKNGRYFTRFSIKAILQNPVYLVADRYAYDYFRSVGTELFSDRKEFDGVHGIMAYNRTSQEKGKTTEFLPPSEWIVSVGQHPGLIPGRTWTGVMAALEKNKNKTYRKARTNEALLTGVLYCSCGSRMYPKLGKCRTAEGKQVYSYVCKMKEHSRKSLCNGKNVNGNQLDEWILDQLSRLKEDRVRLLRQLEEGRADYEKALLEDGKQSRELQKKKAGLEKKIKGLVDSLAELEEEAARKCVVERISQLNQEWDVLDAHICERRRQEAAQELGGSLTDSREWLFSLRKGGILEMSLLQKRCAVQRLLQKVVWDGTTAHVILYGAEADKTCSASSGNERFPDTAMDHTKTHKREDSK